MAYLMAWVLFNCALTLGLVVRGGLRAKSIRVKVGYPESKYALLKMLITFMKDTGYRRVRLWKEGRPLELNELGFFNIKTGVYQQVTIQKTADGAWCIVSSFSKQTQGSIELDSASCITETLRGFELTN